MSGNLITTKDAASLLGVSVCTLEKWRKRGIGPSYLRLGPRSIRYSAEAIYSHATVCTVSAPTTVG